VAAHLLLVAAGAPGIPMMLAAGAAYLRSVGVIE